MKYKTIPKGYQITFKTWENDADNYNTKVVEGLTEEQAKMFVEIAELHYSQHGYHSKGFGNMYEPCDKEIEEYKQAIEIVALKHFEVLKEYFGEGLTIEDVFEWITQNITYEIGLSGTSEFYTRVLDSYSVVYVPEDVQLLECTDQFL